MTSPFARHRLLGLTLALTTTLLTGCAAAANTPSTDLDAPSLGYWEVSHDWVNGEIYDCTWRAENARFIDGILTLELTGDANRRRDFACAEYRTLEHYGYGYYQVRMRAARAPGVLSSFFLFTGAPFLQPHDEIDFEFLGKDTTEVQVNYFVDGVGKHEEVIDLGFDAAEDFHTYGIEWRADAIRWYVDCELVHEVRAEDGPLPSTPGRIYLHLWNGHGVDDWLGEFDYDGQIISASYDWVSARPEGVTPANDELRGCRLPVEARR